MVEIKLKSKERNVLLQHPLIKVLSGISDYMDETNIDESEMEIKSNKFTFTLSVKRKKGS